MIFLLHRMIFEILIEIILSPRLALASYLLVWFGISIFWYSVIYMLSILCDRKKLSPEIAHSYAIWMTLNKTDVVINQNSSRNNHSHGWNIQRP
jgi:hypothetical protein